jgi:D-3-phosphoglycerate dehydrogenase
LKPEGVESLEGPDQLQKVAQWCQILILTLPLNAQTHHSIDRQVFDSMPKGSYLINVARGACVKEVDLIESLQSGHLAGAGLDVAEEEPLPPSSPLWTLPNVILTPHVGAQAARRVDDTTRLICENLRRYRDGKPLLNEVDKRLGFPHPSRLAQLHCYPRD